MIDKELVVNAALVAENKVNATVKDALPKYVGRSGGVPTKVVALDTGISEHRLAQLWRGDGRPVSKGELFALMQRLPVGFALEVLAHAGLTCERQAAPQNVCLHDAQEALLEAGAEIARVNKRGRLCHRTLPILKEKCRVAAQKLFGILRREVRQEQAA